MLYRRKFAEPAAAALSFYLLIFGIAMAGPLEAASVYWTGGMSAALALQTILLATPTVALLLLFPSGAFVPTWTRWVFALTIPWNVLLIFVPVYNSVAISQQPGLFVAYTTLWICFMGVGIYAQIYRYRRVAGLAERQQTRWVLYGFAIWFGIILLTAGPYFYLEGLPPDAPSPWWVPASELVWFLSLNILPICLTVAITRYRLWDIDLVVNRTLVYGALTAGVVVLYFGGVVGLGLLFQPANNLLIPLLTAGLAAVVFNPLRVRLQGTINRMMYGERDDPVAVLSRLSTQLEMTGSPTDALNSIVETITQALKLPYAAIELREGTKPAATFGVPTNELQRFALVHQGVNVGQMVVATRAAQEPFNPKDLRLLKNMAQQAGAAAHAVRLTADLQYSRERLVTAREEERRRIRRDLHDGLGPTLAVQALKQEEALEALSDDPAGARILLEELNTETQQLLTDVRRLAYDLRPPALDELGLVAAVREQAIQMLQGANGLRVDVHAPPDLPELPAAVETAAYRIAVEAISNVGRHTKAQICTVRFKLSNEMSALHFEVEDDGQGNTHDLRAGVGLTSMKERAEELGGHLTIENSSPRGLIVRAVLPVPVRGNG